MLPSAKDLEAPGSQSVTQSSEEHLTLHRNGVQHTWTAHNGSTGTIGESVTACNRTVARTVLEAA